MADPALYPKAMRTIAPILLGEPNKKLSKANEWRYGTRGSLLLRLDQGTWADNEAGESGGLIELIMRERGGDAAGAFRFLIDNGAMPDDPPDGERNGHKNGHHDKPALGKIIASYDYEDEAGELLLRVDRYEPKDFRQRRPDPSSRDGWSWQTRDVRKVPYRLPELIEAVALGKTIFMVEGEKAVERLREIGVPATSPPGGAGKWDDNFNQYFVGADLVILPDNDPQAIHPKTKEPRFHEDGRPVLPGQDHANDVAKRLTGIAAQVRLLELPGLPVKGDAFDWIEAGGDADALYALADARAYLPGEKPGEKLRATPYHPDDLKAVQPRRWVYGRLAIRKYVTVLGSPGGTGKTALAVATAVAIASGKPLLQQQVHDPGAVWLYNLEDDRDEMVRRVAACMMHHDVSAEDIEGRLFVDSGRDQPLIIATRTKDTLIATPQVEQMIAELKARKISVLMVDPFIKSHRLEENRNEQIDFAASLWARIAGEADCSIILLHHFKKGGVSGEADAMRGAAALVDASRVAVTLAPMTKSEADMFNVEGTRRTRIIRIDNAKLNLAPRPEHAEWIELVSQIIPTGDSVQVATMFTSPALFAGVSVEVCNLILTALDRGEDEPYSPHKQARGRWAGAIMIGAGASNGVEISEAQATRMLAAWIKSGALEVREYKRGNRNPADGVYVNDAKRPGVMDEA